MAKSSAHLVVESKTVDEFLSRLEWERVNRTRLFPVPFEKLSGAARQLCLIGALRVLAKGHHYADGAR